MLTNFPGYLSILSAPVGCIVMYRGFAIVMPSLAHYDKLGAESISVQGAHLLEGGVRLNRHSRTV